jgi:TolA-binding protein
LTQGGGFSFRPQSSVQRGEADEETLKTAQRNLEELKWTQDQLEKMKHRVAELQEELEQGREAELAASGVSSLV